MTENIPEIPEQEADVSKEDFEYTDQRFPLPDNTLIQQVNAWATSFALWFAGLWKQWVERLPERWDNFLVKHGLDWQSKVEKIRKERAKSGTGIDAEIQEEIDEISEWGTLSKVIGLVYLGISLRFSRWGVWMEGLKARQARTVNKDILPSMISHSEIMRYMYLYPDRASAVRPLLGELGIEDSQQEIAFDAMRQVPQYAQVLELRNRDLITDVEAIDMFQQSGVSEGDAGLLLKLRFFYPGPADIATLTGREAFEADSIKRFNLDVDFDRIPKEVYEKAGMTAEQMKWYWIAHWQNPGLVQVFQMLHRLRDPNSADHFGEEDMDIFFNLADITPYFRERLKAIAFTPFTRVDIRRMYNTGVLGYNEVVSAYQDIGYEAENAKKMADFTVRLEDFNERDLSKTQVEKLYEIGELSYEEFLDALEAVGYDESEALYVAALKVSSMAADRIDAVIDRAEWEYKRHLIDAAGVNTLLGPAGIKTGRIEQYIEQWDNENVTEQTLPTKADIIGWFDSGIVSQRAAVDLLRKRHYSEINILRYLDLVPDQFVESSDIEIVAAGQLSRIGGA